jgi:hypothetical protein
VISGEWVVFGAKSSAIWWMWGCEQKNSMVMAPGKWLGCGCHFTKGFPVQYQLISDSHIGAQYLLKTTTN